IGDPLNAVIDTFNNVTCFAGNDGQVALDLLSGNGDYTFLWSNGQDNNPAIGLSSGDYQVTVTDRLGCTTVLNQTIGQPASPLSINLLENRAASCYAFSDGFLEVAGDGGTFPYQFLWSSGDSTRTLSDLAAGDYVLTIVDQSGCQTVQTVTLDQPQPIQADFMVTEPSCFGDTDGLIEVAEITGGTPALNFPNYEVSRFTDFSDPSYVYVDLAEGEHVFYIRDERGCTATQSVLMTEPSDWDLSIALEGDTAILLCDTILLEARPTTTGASFQWMAAYPLGVDSLATLSVAPLFTGSISVDATVGACTKTASIGLVVDDQVEVYIPNAFTPCGTTGCDDVNDYFTAFSDYPAAKRIRSMRIANRWGQTVFQKDNLPLSDERAGWDGRFNDEAMSAGKYVYYIVVETVRGDLEFQGTLLLIR
ncbi:MAG: gliding motility-associated C-terminal domain-containing protein, partial [Bacteroidota bacterium]